MNDMDVAGEVFSAMLDARVTLNREPVCSVASAESVLYHVCQTSVLNSRGHTLQPVQFIPALERASLIRLFDRHVVKQAISSLRARPDSRLGVEVSAQSSVADVVWEAIFQLIEQTPDVAERLVIEIPEAAWFDAHERVQRFTQSLKHAGCKIAIADFGIETAIGVRSPDIIKIDASFTAAARHGRVHVEHLAQLIRRAAKQAETVVVEGVDEPVDIMHVRECGAQWAQGQLVTALFSDGPKSASACSTSSALAARTQIAS
ncbi:EAL domain-containing protein [Paraburkholderia sprentiae WSM5005]|uniref:EAL domain-containing protein n=1 Tax=Paraburkholderia sprentiae WSM5005 TaxID=754502 RepID=A0A1I9YJM6_9BURK|nr:EAL domain-containing protein [Paraburkholderia sprentiae]APA86509.2 EAL domain-containing protein [Paraburkholderia sprentiae WSM5005]